MELAATGSHAIVAVAAAKAGTTAQRVSYAKVEALSG